MDPSNESGTHQLSVPAQVSHAEASNVEVSNGIQASAPNPLSHGDASSEHASVESVSLGGHSSLWERAFDSLTEEQKTSLAALVACADEPSMQPAPASASIVSEWIAILRQRQEQCEKSSWRIKSGKTPKDDIILRDQAGQIISWLTKAGDIGVQFAPSIVIQLWPVVKALLNIPVKEADQMAAVFTVADKIARLVVRGSIYERCYNSMNTPPDALANLHAALLALYTASLGLLSTASSLLNSNGFYQTDCPFPSASWHHQD